LIDVYVIVMLVKMRRAMRRAVCSRRK